MFGRFLCFNHDHRRFLSFLETKHVQNARYKFIYTIFNSEHISNYNIRIGYK